MSVEWIPNCGHFIPEEKPEVVMKSLSAILGDKCKNLFSSKI